MVSDIMVSLEIACRLRGDVRLLIKREIPLSKATRNQRAPFQWTVTGFPSGDFSITFAPGTSRSCPFVTTFSPGITPFSMMLSCPTVRPTATPRSSAEPSSFTTKTCGPSCPMEIALAGTTVTPDSVPSRMMASMKAPGHSEQSSFKKWL